MIPRRGPSIIRSRRDESRLSPEDSVEPPVSETPEPNAPPLIAEETEEPRESTIAEEEAPSIPLLDDEEKVSTEGTDRILERLIIPIFDDEPDESADVTFPFVIESSATIPEYQEEPARGPVPIREFPDRQSRQEVEGPVERPPVEDAPPIEPLPSGEDEWLEPLEYLDSGAPPSRIADEDEALSGYRTLPPPITTGPEVVPMETDRSSVGEDSQIFFFDLDDTADPSDDTNSSPAPPTAPFSEEEGGESVDNGISIPETSNVSSAGTETEYPIERDSVLEEPPEATISQDEPAETAGREIDEPAFQPPPPISRENDRTVEYSSIWPITPQSSEPEDEVAVERGEAVSGLPPHTIPEAIDDEPPISPVSAPTTVLLDSPPVEPLPSGEDEWLEPLEYLDSGVPPSPLTDGDKAPSGYPTLPPLVTTNPEIVPMEIDRSSIEEDSEDYLLYLDGAGVAYDDATPPTAPLTAPLSEDGGEESVDNAVTIPETSIVSFDRTEPECPAEDESVLEEPPEATFFRENLHGGEDRAIEETAYQQPPIVSRRLDSSAEAHSILSSTPRSSERKGEVADEREGVVSGLPAHNAPEIIDDEPPISPVSDPTTVLLDSPPIEPDPLPKEEEDIPPAPSAGKGKRTLPAFNLDRLMTVAIIIALVVCLVGISLLLTQKPVESYTEFYILDEKGRTVDYPSTQVPSDPSQLWIGIGNREHRSVRYVVELYWANVSYNVAQRSTTVGGMNRFDLLELDVPDEGTVQVPYTLKLSEKTGNSMILLLFNENVPPCSVRGVDRIKKGYRYLFLTMNDDLPGGKTTPEGTSTEEPKIGNTTPGGTPTSSKTIEPPLVFIEVTNISTPVVPDPDVKPTCSG
jgi:hypothetical protein